MIPALTSFLATFLTGISQYEKDPDISSYPWLDTLNTFIGFMESHYKPLFLKLFPRKRKINSKPSTKSVVETDSDSDDNSSDSAEDAASFSSSCASASDTQDASVKKKKSHKKSAKRKKSKHSKPKKRKEKKKRRDKVQQQTSIKVRCQQNTRFLAWNICGPCVSVSILVKVMGWREFAFSELMTILSFSVYRSLKVASLQSTPCTKIKIGNF